MSRCKHDSGNIQQFTEICLDCGHNIYETDEEYEASLKKEIASLRQELRQHHIDDLERMKDDLQTEVNRRRGNDDNNSGGW